MRPIYTIDIETDPFQVGRYPKPFCIGFYDGVTFTYFWGRGCIEKMHDFIIMQPPGIIYAHNGGRFDIFYIMDWVLGNAMRIINSRIIKAEMEAATGWHEIRDSFAIMPFALGKFKGAEQKKTIDIDKLEKTNRQKYKAEIVDYLFYDCKVLWNLCSAFIEKFGPQLTIGTTAMKELRKIHEFDSLDSDMDKDIRSRYYYGGRVECFEKGVIEAELSVYDVNSMYPSVMRDALHPIGLPSSEGNKVKNNTCFISVIGENNGAFPMRVKGGGIRFDVPYGEFHVTRHEWDAALDHGLFVPHRVTRCINFDSTGNFADFVDTFYDARLAAKKNGDAILELFYKFILNSAYGKFGQNPDNYAENIITDSTANLHEDGWTPTKLVDYLSGVPDKNYIVWSRPTRDISRFNVATGSSITGASRAVLLKAIATARRPVYCDTDSLICESMDAAMIDPDRLGAWKLETKCDTAAIAGKKLYALFAKDKKVKQANKGVNVTALEILAICKGQTVTSKRDAPSFKLDGSHNFITRKVRMT